jgi:hypothetical protein
LGTSADAFVHDLCDLMSRKIVHTTWKISRGDPYTLDASEQIYLARRNTLVLLSDRTSCHSCLSGLCHSTAHCASFEACSSAQARRTNCRGSSASGKERNEFERRLQQGTCVHLQCSKAATQQESARPWPRIEAAFNKKRKHQVLEEWE